jgi:16S rRNA (guanine(966)-N(2))-methyltransferase RsmD
MRISAGHLKGRKVAFPRVFARKTGGAQLRPTSAKVREALFDIIRGEISGALFLDLYAGTGAVGFEALSQGADRIVFVETDQQHHLSIVQCIERLNLSAQATVHKERAIYYLKRNAGAGRPFDIIFADPPYASEETSDLIKLIDHTPVLREGGCLVIEHSSKIVLPVPEEIHSLRHIKDYRYGDSMLSLFRKGE